MEAYREKREQLHRLMNQYTKGNAAVAFSGGADSSLLLKLAVAHGKENGSQVFAFTVCGEIGRASCRERV